MWLSVPALVLIHLITVVVLTRTFNESFISYLRRSEPGQNSSSAQLVGCVLKSQCILAVLASALIILNRFSSNIFKCADPLNNVTIAPIKTETHMYQWIWISMSCISLALNSWMLEELRRKRFAERAQSVYTALCTFVAEALPQKKALDVWHSQMPHHDRVPHARRLLYWSMHLPFILLMIIPSFGCALTQWRRGGRSEYELLRPSPLLLDVW